MSWLHWVRNKYKCTFSLLFKNFQPTYHFFTFQQNVRKRDSWHKNIIEINSNFFLFFQKYSHFHVSLRILAKFKTDANSSSWNDFFSFSVLSSIISPGISWHFKMQIVTSCCHFKPSLPIGVLIFFFFSPRQTFCHPHARPFCCHMLY